MVASALLRHGQFLFRSGAPCYNKYSESINAIAAFRPALRRSLGSAWDLAFAWMAEEPHEHHRALPKGVLLACLTIALLWGWLTEAALLVSVGQGYFDLVKLCDFTSRCSAWHGLRIASDQGSKTRGRARLPALTLQTSSSCWTSPLQVSSHIRSFGLCRMEPSADGSLLFCLGCSRSASGDIFAPAACSGEG